MAVDDVHVDRQSGDQIAIVGIGCRFPGGVHDAASFWELLRTKKDGVVEVPADRWNLDKFYDPDPAAPGRMYSRRGGFLTDSVWDFDPEFFGISPREASIVDPQQRLLLEVCWEALEDAGLTSRVHGRRVGVYIGAFTSDNAISRVTPAARPFISGHTPLSYTFTLLSNRLSYVLNLRGPSMTIDTACSSSLVAVHQARQAILAGECESALAGGVNIMLHPETSVSMSKGRFLSADGRCKAFDASADGYGRGEGAGIVVLKRLDAARRDGDRVYAIVRGTGVNQDGRTSAIPVPNPVAQEELARAVCADAGIAPHEVGYVEAHGTGTPVGDPLEMTALGKVYGTAPGRQRPLDVGSVKASIGHLEAAAGVAGLIKASLTVYHRAIVPQGWLERLNPEIPFAELNIRVPTEVHELPDAGDVLAAVNSFGYGGTNAHAIVQAPEPVSLEPAPPVFPVLPISGRNPEATRELARRFATLIGQHDIHAVVAAAWSRRVHHPFRAAFDFSDPTDLQSKLQNFAMGADRPPLRAFADRAARPVFVFSGMGPQWWRMGRDLLESGGAFARTAQQIDTEFAAISGWSLIEELRRPEEDSRVTTTEIAQPANFLVQVCLAAELTELGVRPAAIVGHSVGEVSAAFVSGMLSLRDALLVSYHRARLQATTGGAMVAVGLPESEALAVISNAAGVEVAAVNSPTSVTIAGDRAAVARVREELAATGAFVRALDVEVGYHSHLMDPILDELRRSLVGLVPQEPRIPLFSTVSGTRVSGPDWDADYWCRNVREPVRFYDAVTGLVADGRRVFLEIGPHPVLSGSIREILVRSGETGTSIGTLSRKEGDLVGLRRAIAELYIVGGLDDSSVPGGPEGTRHVPLPAYPWQKTRVWMDTEPVLRDRLGTDIRYPMLGERRELAVPEWVAGLSVSALPWLHDHVVGDAVVLPGAAYLDAALSAAAIRTGREEVALEDVRFVTPLVIDPHDVPLLRSTVEESTKRFTMSARSAQGATWTLHASGRLVEGPLRPRTVELPTGVDTSMVRGADLYPVLGGHGLAYGPAFQRVVDARIGADFVIAEIDASLPKSNAHLVHPAVLDAALQCVAALALRSDSDVTGAVVPTAVRTVRRFGPIPDAATVLVRRASGTLRADIDILDAEGRQVLTLGGVEFRPVSPSMPVLDRLARVFYEPRWERLDELAAEAATAPVREFGMVVAVGDSAVARARSIAGCWPSATVLEVADILGPDVETDIAAGLRAGLANDEIDRARLLVLAGDGFAASDTVYALARIARAAATLDDPITGVVVTVHGLCLPAAGPADLDLSHGGLIGARRSLFNEQPSRRWLLIDTEPGTSVDEIVREVLHSTTDGAGHDEVCLRSGTRWAQSVRGTLAEHLSAREKQRAPDDAEGSFRLESPRSRLLEDLAWREADRTPPGDGEIEIRMDALGLNAKDAYKVLGVLSDEYLEGTFFGTGIGLEGSGTVVETGPGVSGIGTGDRVLVSAPEMARRFLTTDQNYAVVVPRHWEPGVCSSWVPFLTAEIALGEAARLRSGEVVLVHGGAGGVGLAAIQVARRLGAVVIAAAGSAQRRTYALSAGAHHAIDSRTVTFVDDVLRITEGRGADVVLSSVPGEFVRQNLNAAAEFGRIVEIGKADIYGGGVLDLRPFDRNLSFIAVDLDRLMRFRPLVIRTYTLDLVAKLEAGVYRHLPFQVYPSAEVAAAFEAVVRPKRIGRVVLDLDQRPSVGRRAPQLGIDSAASYLVTGGFGAFGLATARWLVRAGARHLVLVGRRGAAGADAERQLAEFVAAGVEVVEERVDIAQYDAVTALIARVASRDVPLRGVFHAAGIVDNTPVESLTAERIEQVFAGKLDGARNLDGAVRTAGIELDHFVLWSSVSAVLGGFPQVAYAAANAALQAFAHQRRRRGEPALCLDWGSMAGGGMAEADSDTVRYLAAVGLRAIPMDTGTDYLGECLRLGVAHASIIDIDWTTAAATTPAVTKSARFADYAQGSDAEGSGSAALRARIIGLPPEDRPAAVTAELVGVLAVVMGVSPDAVDTQTPLLELGMDSLMAVEFAARAGRLTGVELAPVQMARALGFGLSDIGVKMAGELERAEKA
ncbi:SDR family NAD(P)-dependent oxidoreductase [Nocardia suismassiliense]|uniref:SDR family NAD(P)-dependent oxidoreductase n=1 Tax=Nocardia suismassiliense TaxID=2077092 RepID=A0ABW6QY57_9NOCA